MLGNSQHWSLAKYCLGQEDPYKALKWGSKFCLEIDFYRKGSDLQNEKKKKAYGSSEEKLRLMLIYLHPINKWIILYVLFHIFESSATSRAM